MIPSAALKGKTKVEMSDDDASNLFAAVNRLVMKTEDDDLLLIILRPRIGLSCFKIFFFVLGSFKVSMNIIWSNEIRKNSSSFYAL